MQVTMKGVAGMDRSAMSCCEDVCIMRALLLHYRMRACMRACCMRVVQIELVAASIAHSVRRRDEVLITDPTILLHGAHPST